MVIRHAGNAVVVFVVAAACDHLREPEDRPVFRQIRDLLRLEAFCGVDVPDADPTVLVRGEERVSTG